MSKHLPGTILFLLFTGCIARHNRPAQQRLRQVERQDNGILEKRVFDYIDMPGMERIELYYPNGRLREVYYSQNGQLNGLRKVFYDNGILSETGNWHNDVREGIFRYYTPNGQLDCERFFGLFTNNLQQ
jgi:antitoxin component YwqK of YwqJK toxin-antitoxin module